MDPQMNRLLKWSVQNSQQNPDGTAPPPSAEQAGRKLTPDMINALFGGPSEAELMKAAMEVLHSDESDLENKLIAFDNFEQLIESIDNANNLEPLGLWTPLIQLLKHEEADMRRMAAWCVGTAVQNNEKAQDKVCSNATLQPVISSRLTFPVYSLLSSTLFLLSSTWPPPIRTRLRARSLSMLFHRPRAITSPP